VVLHHPVEHDLHSCREVAAERLGSHLLQLVDLLHAPATAPPHRPDRGRDQLVGGGQPAVGRVRLVIDVGVLPGGDPLGEQVLLPGKEAGAHVVGAVLRDQFLDERGGAFVKSPLRLVPVGPLDPTVHRIRSRGIDAGHPQRDRVGPGPMSVGVVDQDRTVGDDCVEGLLGRATAGEPGLGPPAPQDPGQVGIVGGVSGDEGHGVVGVSTSLEGAAKQVEATAARVAVGVLETGGEHPTGQVHHPGPFPDRVHDCLLVPYRTDPIASDRDPPGERPGRPGGEHGPVDEDQIGGHLPILARRSRPVRRDRHARPKGKPSG
jgi:hypothetical protein